MPNATLPQMYEHAREALTECSRVDECKDWADKAAALASYRCANDHRWRDEAVRTLGMLDGTVVPTAMALIAHEVTVSDEEIGRPESNRCATTTS